MSILTSHKSCTAEYDPATMHPASILSVKETSALSDRIVRGTVSGDIHPASLPSAQRLIRDGYGELVLRVREGETLRPVTKGEYAKAYRIFQKYAPRLEENPIPLEKSRIEMMREELRTVNPNMVATFIPRTLFELIFIRKAIEEDLRLETQFPGIDALSKTLYKNSWCCFSSKDSMPVLVKLLSDAEVHLERLIDVGYRLNEAAIQEIDQIEENIEDLSYAQIQKLLDSEIFFLDQFATTRLGTLLPRLLCAPFILSGAFTKGTPSVNNPAIKNLLKKAVFIECHESSIGKILLYRGGDIASDSPVKEGTPYSISFGISLFAGMVKDRTACAYDYMRLRENERDAYLLSLDPAKESSRMIRIVPLTAIEALFGFGEMFHCRFLCSREESDEDITGVDIDGDGFDPSLVKADKYKLLKNPYPREQTMEKFADLKNKNLFLFHHKAPIGFHLN